MPAENDILAIIRQTLEDGKGTDIVVLPTSQQSGGFFDWLIIATASSSRHTQALAERLHRALKESGVKKYHKESSKEDNWLLVDAGSVIVHIMQAEARTTYDLESLWGFEKATP